jgi:hypothetical protein
LALVSQRQSKRQRLGPLRSRSLARLQPRILGVRRAAFTIEPMLI